jgi:hypothetical protein
MENHHHPENGIEEITMPGEPQILAAPDPDKLPEKQMALRLGTTVKALQTRGDRK